MRLNALFRLAFASATPLGLTSPHTVPGRLWAPLSGFVQTAPSSPDPAPRPVHAAARAYIGGTRVARWSGRDWPRAAGSAIDGAPRRSSLVQPGAQPTGLPLRIPSALQIGWPDGATPRRSASGSPHAAARANRRRGLAEGRLHRVARRL